MSTTPTIVTAVAVTPVRRAYPHVKEVADWPTQQTAQLLWERVHDLEGRLQAAEGTITRLVTGQNTTAATVAQTTDGLASVKAQVASQATGAASGTGSGGSVGSSGATDHTDVVASIKADLVSRTISLVGPCGAFEITRRVAWQLRGEGAGLLDKPTGNNCSGYAVDIIAYADGSIVDVVGSAGGVESPPGTFIPGTGNIPQWDRLPVVDPTRWRTPPDPGP